MKPLFRWTGGKRQLRDRILQEIKRAPPAHFVEPFVGAGAVGLAVAAQLPEAQLTFNDANQALMGLWHCLIHNPRQLQLATRWFEQQYKHLKIDYLQAREQYNQQVLALQAAGTGFWFDTTMAAFMLYMIAHSYNGLWRVNQRGEFNTPFGGEQQAHFRYPTEAAMLEASQLLRGRVTLHAEDFEEVITGLGASTHAIVDQQILVYADPPYMGGFDQYTASGFTDEDQRRLAKALENVAARGARVIASNADDPLIHEIYDWARVEPLLETRRVAAKPSKRTHAPCVLIQYP